MFLRCLDLGERYFRVPTTNARMVHKPTRMTVPVSAGRAQVFCRIKFCTGTDTPCKQSSQPLRRMPGQWCQISKRACQRGSQVVDRSGWTEGPHSFAGRLCKQGNYCSMLSCPDLQHMSVIAVSSSHPPFMAAPCWPKEAVSGGCMPLCLPPWLHQG